MSFDSVVVVAMSFDSVVVVDMSFDSVVVVAMSFDSVVVVDMSFDSVVVVDMSFDKCGCGGYVLTRVTNEQVVSVYCLLNVDGCLHRDWGAGHGRSRLEKGAWGRVGEKTDSVWCCSC